MKYNMERFENVPSLMRALSRPLNSAWNGKTPSSDSMYSNFHGVDSFEEALRLFQNGDLNLAKKVRDVKLRDVSTNAPKRARVYSPVGGTVCVPRLLSGSPYCMRRTKKTHGSSKVISIYYNASVSCRYSAEEVLEVNKKLVNMVNALTLDGYSIQVYYLNICESRKNVYTFVYKFKSFQESFNLARTAFVLGHPAMLRGIWFRYIEHSNYTLDTEFSIYYGHPYYPTKQELIKQNVMQENDVLVDFQKLKQAKEACELLK